MDRERLAVCVGVAVFAVAAAFWFAEDLPKTDRTDAWLKCAIAAALCAPIGPIIRWMEGWVPSRPLTKPATQLGMVAVSTVLVGRLLRLAGPELLMVFEVVAATTVVSLAIAYRKGT
jgi:hypothetical protein